MPMRIVQASDRPNIGFGELGLMCEQDPLFRKRLITHVNSAAFGAGRRVTTVQQAISLLGVGGVRNIALEACIEQVAPPSAAPGHEELFGLCLRRGVAARLCAEKLGRSNLHDCFLVGLLLDAGLIEQSGENMESAMGLARSPASMRVVLAAAAGEEEHPQRGAHMAEAMQLDAETVEAIARHHDVNPPGMALGDVAWLAERIAAVFEGGDAALHRRHAVQAGERLGLSAAEIDEILGALPKRVQETAAQFRRAIDQRPELDSLLSNAEGSSPEVARNYAELCARLETLVADRARLTAELRQAREQLASLALSDALTGLPSERAFREALTRDLARADRQKHALALIVIEADYLQLIAESHGKDLADRVIQTLARTLREVVRGADFPARIGADQFALILPNTGVELASGVAERLRKKVAQLAWDEPELRPTLSLGIAGTQGPGCRGAERALLDAASSALKLAQREGRNRTRTANHA
jgi:diguanylate cyclase (GGDEF)-like protein